jgi:hypothetical protein
VDRYAELSKATTVDEIVSVTSAYLADCAPEALERLPASCRPGRVADSSDIEEWADRLLAESKHARLFMEDERTLDRLTNHFLIASVRIRQLSQLSRVAA